jgi:hypothetical protein
LKAIEAAQEKYPTGTKTQVTFTKKYAYTKANALWEALGFLTPFIGIAFIMFIFRKTDPTDFLNKIGKPAKGFKV